MWLGTFLTGMLCECGVLGDILFICVEFIGVWVGVGMVSERWCGDSLFCCGFEQILSVSLDRK